MARGLGDYAKYGSIGISWVLATGVYLYLGYRAGAWLDTRLGTAPVFLVGGVVMATGISLYSLVKELLAVDRAIRQRAAETGRGEFGPARERKHFPDDDRSSKGKGDKGKKPC